MAKPKTDPVMDAPAPVHVSPQEPTYTPHEIAFAAQKRFGIHQDLALAALARDGKAAYTVSEAEAIIRKFAKREVL